MDNAFEYAIDNGMCSENDEPYIAAYSKCNECKEPMPEGTRGLWLRGQGVRHIRCECKNETFFPIDKHIPYEEFGIVFDDRPLNTVSNDDDFQSRKKMREDLRG